MVLRRVGLIKRHIDFLQSLSPFGFPPAPVVSFDLRGESSTLSGAVI